MGDSPVSMLTKIFIVLLVVFSIFFTSMTISSVAQSTNWRETAAKYEEHARVADTNLRHAHAANAALIANARDEVRAHLDTIGDLEAQLQSSRNEAAEIKARIAKSESEKSGAEAINRGLLAQLQIAEASRTEYRNQRDELERRNIDIERRNIDLNDRVNELTTGTAVLVEQRRQYEQQINILRTENEKLAHQARTLSSGGSLKQPEGMALHGVRAMTPVPATAIRGRVLETSGNLVTISVGSADGVKKNMIFVIHRDGEYIGDLKINTVDPNQSAGRLVRSIANVLANDQVTDALYLSGSRG